MTVLSNGQRRPILSKSNDGKFLWFHIKYNDRNLQNVFHHELSYEALLIQTILRMRSNSLRSMIYINNILLFEFIFNGYITLMQRILNNSFFLKTSILTANMLIMVNMRQSHTGMIEIFFSTISQICMTTSILFRWYISQPGLESKASKGASILWRVRSDKTNNINFVPMTCHM